MADDAKGQVSKSAADIYEEFFVPALFKGWTGTVLKHAQVKPGDTILDVACGTGALTRAAYEKISPEGKVSGIDLNAGMITTARRTNPNIDWRVGPAEKLPFEDNSFDAVISQFGLMFFENKVKGLEEMWRVLRPGGHLVVAVWAGLDQNPGYKAATDLLARLFGEVVANELKAPYVLGDTKDLQTLAEQAGIREAKVSTEDGTTRYPSIEQWMFMDVKGWTIGDMIDDQQYETLINEAKTELAHLVDQDGAVVFKSPAHLITAVKN